MAVAERRILNKSCILIIVIASVERFAYKGVAANLVTYLTDVLHESTSVAAKNVNNWCGVTSMLPLIGAALADSYGNRYSTILASSVFYILGLVSLTSSALVRKKRSSFPLFWSLYLISMGQGGYNPCLQAFGANQLEDEVLPVENKGQKNVDGERSLFFQCWYFGICTGSLMGVTLLTYVQETFGWAIGFAIPTVAMTISVFSFLCASPCYVHKQSIHEIQISPILDTIKAFGRKMIGRNLSLAVNNEQTIELELEEKQGLVDDGGGLVPLQGKLGQNTSSPEDARVVLRLLPLWITCLMFAVVFQQPTTFFTKQGITMKRNIGKSFEIPPATLQSAITISIILLMPIYDPLIMPILKRVTGSEQGITTLQRISIGMFLSVVAMVIAALLETKRLQLPTFSGGGGDETRSDLVHLSILWLLPQYILLGISDVFTVVGMQEFFYSQVPKRMGTIGIALYTSVFGFGSFLSAILISLIEFFTKVRGERSWFSDNLSEARLDLYYWLLALLSILSLMTFIGFAKGYGDNRGSTNECLK